MGDSVQPTTLAVLERRVDQLATRLRRERAIAVLVLVSAVCLVAMGAKAPAPRKIVAEEIVMVDDAGREWAVLGMDGHRRRGLHLLGGSLGDVPNTYDRMRPLLSLVGPYVSLADFRSGTRLSLEPSAVELRSGEAHAELRVLDEQLPKNIDTPQPGGGRLTQAVLSISAASGRGAMIVASNNPQPTVVVGSTGGKAIVVNEPLPSPPGAVREVWSAPAVQSDGASHSH